MTRDKGWIKPLLVLGAANLVPVVGWLGLEGYALEWARLTAWNVDSSPKQKDVKVGGCIASGWRAFVASLGYIVVMGLVSWLIGGGHGSDAGGLRGLLIWILGVLIGGLANIAVLRATLYQNFVAGYRLDRIWEMVRRDGNGFLRIIVDTVLLGLGVGVLEVIVAALCVAPAVSSVALLAFGSAGGYALSQLASSLSGLVPALLVFLYFASILFAWTQLMCSTMWGFWMRQFDVARWGASGDPLPTEGAGPDHPEKPQLPGASG